MEASMIEASALLAASISLQARIMDAMKAAKDAGDIERYGILAAAEAGIGTVRNILGDARLRDK
jgi:hypothetical protein